ncbi:MAG: DUF2190 family protein [Rhodoplanes sp.]
MAKTFVQPGDTVDPVAPVGGVKSGDVVVVGNLIGVAQTDALEGVSYALALEGVWRLPKASGAINAGAKVWWDAGNGNVANASGSGLFPLGCAVAAAGANDTTALIRLDGVATAAVAP